MFYLDAVYTTVRDYPGGAESLAPRLGMSANVLRNKVNPSIKTHHLRLDEAVSIMAMTGDSRGLEAIADELGYMVIPATGIDLSNEDLLLQFNSLYQQLGKFSADTNDAIADGHLDATERRRLYRDQLQVAAKIHEIFRQIVAMYGDEDDEH